MLSKIFRHFPTFGSKNIWVFYLFPFVFGSWLAMPNWVFFFSQHISLAQIGLMDALAIGVGVLAEVPTGAVSDLLGKKATLIIAKVIMAIGFVITGFAHQFAAFFIGDLLIFVGYAFQSGALEAFAYDSLVELKQEKHFDTVISRQTFLEALAMFGWMMMGGLLFAINPRLPWWIGGILELIAALSFLLTTEPVVETAAFNIKNYLVQTKQGFLHLFNPRLYRFLLPVLTVFTLLSVTQGVVRQNTAQFFGFTGESFSYAFAIFSLLGAGAVLGFNRIKKLLGEAGFSLLLIGAFMAASMIVWIKPAPALAAGYGYFLIMNLATKLVKTLDSYIVNRRIESRYRATTLSSLNLLAQIPYVVIMIFFVHWAAVDHIGTFFGWTTAILAISLVVSTIIFRLEKLQTS